MQPFDELTADLSVLSSLAALRRVNPDACDCLYRAFDEIKSGTLKLAPFGTRPGLCYTEACGWLITVADAGKTGVVLALTGESATEDLL